MTTLKSILGSNNTETLERNFILENFKLAVRVQEEITPCTTRKMTEDEMRIYGGKTQ